MTLAKDLKFASEIDEYVVLKLVLGHYAGTNRAMSLETRVGHSSIRPQIREDEKRLLQLYFRNWETPHYGRLPGWRDDSAVYMLWNGKLIGGLYVCDRNEFDNDKRWGQLHYFFVDPEFRGKGLHSLLFSEAVHRAQSWGLEGVYINTDRHGLPELYERWGAVLWKRIPKSFTHHKRPNRGPQNWLVYKIHNKALLEAASKYLKGKLIDIGCGDKPYSAMLAPYVTEHIGVDHKQTIHNKSNVDRFGTAYKIPAGDASFDSAICIAVLEHTEEPEQALRECYRVLKAGGIAIYSVPFIWHLHEEPRDFYRFSKYGLRYLFEKTGFEIIELKALSGFWVTFGQLFVYNIYRFNRGPLRWFGIVPIVGLLLQGLAYFMDKVDKTEQWTWMYLVVARKP